MDWKQGIESTIHYWLRENLSALPMEARYEYLLEFNEKILIGSLLNQVEGYISSIEAEAHKRGYLEGLQQPRNLQEAMKEHQ